MIHEIIASNADVDVRFYYSNDAGSYVPPHWHESLELVYIIEGCITVTTSKKTAVIRENEVSLVDSRIVHSVKTGGNKAIVLQIPLSLLKKAVPAVGSLCFSLSHLSQTEKKKINEYLGDTIKKMYEIYEKKELGYLLIFEAKLFELLYTLLHRCTEKNSPEEPQKRHLKKVEMVMEYIKKNYSQKCTMSDIADHVGANPDYLSRIFKKSLGMTVINYLYRIRIINVYKDVMNTDDQISEIFQRNGCSNLKLAMKLFKEIYEITPKKARSRNHSENGINLKNRLNSF